MTDYAEEEWLVLYEQALVELEHAKIVGRTANARTAILSRIEKLQTLPGLHEDEKRAISDALRCLGFLEQEEERYQRQERQRAIDEALQKLRSLAPVIEKLGGDASN